jgi:hypothetical protein
MDAEGPGGRRAAPSGGSWLGTFVPAAPPTVRPQLPKPDLEQEAVALSRGLLPAVAGEWAPLTSP